jgi:hypothetical protein
MMSLTFTKILVTFARLTNKKILVASRMTKLTNEYLYLVALSSKLR